MSKFIVTRDGEHIGIDHLTREAAQADIILNKQYDQKSVHEGWITKAQADKTRYWITERKNGRR